MNGITPNICPCCHRNLVITQLHCEQCGTTLSGSFVSLFHQFSEDEQLFIKNFILNSGSFKSVARQMGKSYPTIRKILDHIISKMECKSEKSK